MIRKYRIAVFGAACILMSMAGVHGSQIDIPWFSIDAGGGMSESADGTLNVYGTIGQPDAGTLSSSSFTLVGGFVVRHPDADIDGDGDVDLDDFAEFAPCQAGPDGVIPEGCGSRDLDGDNDVDLKDFSNLQKSFSEQR